MNKALQGKLPSWDRWLPIVRVTPSGKTMFVCLICGRSSPSHSMTCPPLQEPEPGKHRFQHYIENEHPTAKLCHEIEAIINQRIKGRTEPELVIGITENELRQWIQKYCSECHGFGCHVCMGSGYQWGQQIPRTLVKYTRNGELYDALERLSKGEPLDSALPGVTLEDLTEELLRPTAVEDLQRQAARAIHRMLRHPDPKRVWELFVIEQGRTLGVTWREVTGGYQLVDLCCAGRTCLGFSYGGGICDACVAVSL